MLVCAIGIGVHLEGFLGNITSVGQTGPEADPHNWGRYKWEVAFSWLFSYPRVLLTLALKILLVVSVRFPDFAKIHPH